MKAKYILISLALATVFAACNRDEKDLFDKSASERAQAALDNANNVFTGAKNGWEMLYFANPTSCGYNMILRFKADGQVIATAKNETTTRNKLLTDSVSTWDIKNDYGPIITFDTYNSVIHAWSDPGNDGDGLLGDYEFLILHADSSFIKLKGKKHSAYCYLYPLEEGVTEAQYFAEVEANQKKMFGNSNLLHLQASGKEYLLRDGATGIFTLTDLGVVAVGEDPDINPFAVTRTGIQMMVPFLDLKALTYTLQNGELTGEDSKIVPNNPASYIKEYIEILSGSWTIDITDVNDSVANLIETINAVLKATYKNNKKNASVNSLVFKKTTKGLVLVFNYYGNSSKSTISMNYLFDIVAEGGALNISYNGPADDNAQKTLNAFPDIEVLLNTLSGTYDAVADDPINPTAGIKLTNKSNSNLWISISGKI